MLFGLKKGSNLLLIGCFNIKNASLGLWNQGQKIL